MGKKVSAFFILLLIFAMSSMHRVSVNAQSSVAKLSIKNVTQIEYIVKESINGTLKKYNPVTKKYEDVLIEVLDRLVYIVNSTSSEIIDPVFSPVDNPTEVPLGNLTHIYIEAGNEVSEVVYSSYDYPDKVYLYVVGFPTFLTITGLYRRFYMFPVVVPSSQDWWNVILDKINSTLSKQNSYSRAKYGVDIFNETSVLAKYQKELAFNKIRDIIKIDITIISNEISTIDVHPFEYRVHVEYDLETGILLSAEVSYLTKEIPTHGFPFSRKNCYLKLVLWDTNCSEFKNIGETLETPVLQNLLVYLVGITVGIGIVLGVLYHIIESKRKLRVPPELLK